MQEPTDNQLDGLFRKSSEEFDAPFDPAAWQALKNRLDAHDRFIIWEHLLRWGMPVLLLLLLTGGSWNAHRQHTGANPAAGSETSTQQSALAGRPPLAGNPDQQQLRRVGKEPSRLKPLAISAMSNGPDNSLSTPAETPPDQFDSAGKLPLAIAGTTGTSDSRKVSLTNSQDTPPLQTGGADQPARSDVKTKLAGSTSHASRPLPETVSPSSARRTRHTEPVNSRLQSPERGVGHQMASIFSATSYAINPGQSFTNRQEALNAPSEGLADEPQFNKGLPPADNTDQSAVKLSVAALSSQPGRWPKPLSFTGREVTLPTNPAEQESVSSVSPASPPNGLSVRFVVSPDLSAIELRNFQRPGTNVGLLAEYRLASRWSVQIGVVQSTKVYKAMPSDYEWPKGWNWKTMPESVSGRCNMLDIPVNLRYDVALRPRPDGLMASRWFVSGGATTYIMNQEKYVYSYPATAYISSTTPTELSKKTGLYGFSHLNLSAGYERALSRRLAWQVEPFAKVPLKGVGFFKVNLLSTGAFFSLRYKL